jgi:citrate synthase
MTKQLTFSLNILFVSFLGMVISTIAALGTFHPEANPALTNQDVYNDLKLRNKQIHRLLGTVPTIAAFAYRHRIGRPFVNPAGKSLSYAENFLYMLDKLSHVNYKPHPKLARALDILFILHADHELNCSTAAMRHLTSSGVDVYTALAGAGGALYGPRHGGANEAVLRMLEKIGTVDNIPSFIEKVKAKKARLMGFGHRVYKNYDPRAKIVRQVAEEVFSILGREPLIEVAMALEKVALEDKYFVERKLYPNVDFYSGLIYKAMGFPTDFFAVLFLIPRTVGWLAHWSEFLDDPENKIIRPFQVYLGPGLRDYVPMEKRQQIVKRVIQSDATAESRRRNAATSDTQY